MNKKEATIITYNKGAREFARKFNNIGPRIKDIECGFLYISKDNPQVLEIGCGNGRDGMEIMKHTTNYIGIDLSKGMIDLAKELCPSGDFRVADLETFDYPQNTDIVFSFASLLHSDREEVKKVIERVYDSLSSGGIFYISLKYGKYEEVEKKDELGARYFYFYTPEDIKELAGDKYKVVEEDRQTLRGVEWFTIVLQKYNQV